MLVHKLWAMDLCLVMDEMDRTCFLMKGRRLCTDENWSAPDSIVTNPYLMGGWIPREKYCHESNNTFICSVLKWYMKFKAFLLDSPLDDSPWWSYSWMHHHSCRGRRIKCQHCSWTIHCPQSLLQKHGYINTGGMAKLEDPEEMSYGVYPAQLGGLH